MKKLLLVIAVAGLAMLSCNKDRVCSCKDYKTFDGAGAQIVDYEYTMKSVGRLTAFRNCVHSSSTYTQSVYTGTVSSVKTVIEDLNCSLK